MSEMIKFDLLIQELLKEFCDGSNQTLSVEGFRDTSSQIALRDKESFVRAIRAGLINRHRGRQYRAAQSCASESFFWSGRKGLSPRPVTISVEPIISVATLSCLHFSLGWPASHLGTQSSKWGFDLCAYEAPSPPTTPATSPLIIACEIKKSRKELEDLIDLMAKFGAGHSLSLKPVAREKNASKKIDEILIERPRFFWAVGPDRLSYAFTVRYGTGREVHFDQVPEEQLRFRSSE